TDAVDRLSRIKDLRGADSLPRGKSIAYGVTDSLRADLMAASWSGSAEALVKAPWAHFLPKIFAKKPGRDDSAGAPSGQDGPVDMPFSLQ
ncbi:MAG: hypothetical protein Q4D39_04090, partial [Coriobacteriaceae bacterium]|nr:hypothetical protein [Coriobacteriaceae bacterium]